MYTWGYIKNVALAKLDLEEAEASNQKLLQKFHYYANEAITQICSTIKPKHAFFEVDVTEENIGTMITMPEDFISFGNDINKLFYNEHGKSYCREAYDDDFEYVGYNKILCKTVGRFFISYNARWITFTNQDDNYRIDVPIDILDCLPSYIASQCFKIDDEYKASVFRNEYEIFLSRIDDTDFRNTKTFKIEGDW
jgi:hypothetical protein